jgi:methionine sulfoxide reductase heme-binding subunit
VLVPFAMDYRPVWTGLGILAAYLTAGLSLMYYARRRLGARRWRTAHRLVPVAWAMAALHVIGAGTGSLWLQVPIALTMSLALTLLGHRLLAGRPAGGARAPRPGPERPPADPPAGYRPLWARAASPPARRDTAGRRETRA